MERQTDSAIVGRIIQVAFSLALVGIGLYSVRGLMFGSALIAKLAIVGLVGLALIIALNERYWILSAFLFGFYSTIPAIKFTGAELGCIILVGTFFVRQALHYDSRASRFSGIVLAALPFMAWMCFIWMMNPVGMFMFGSSSIGGRFYFKVVLAFFSLFCLSTMDIGPTGAKQLVIAVALGYLTRALYFVFFGGVESAFFGHRLHYAFIPVTYVAPLFLCRFSLPELLVRAGPLLAFSILFFLGVWSGNRTGATRPVVVGLLAPFFLRKDFFRTIVFLFVFSWILAIAVIGQGSFWRLPFAVQRSLSFLPGRWDGRLEFAGFHDDFRAELRYWARQHISENPWLGDGGFSLDFDSMVWSSNRAARGGFAEDIAGHVLARNWHNVWLGMAADFGIPLSVAWGFFMAVLLASGWKTARRMPPGTWHQTAFLYFYLLIVAEFISFFFAGGHTALTAEQIFLWAGMMLAVRNGVPAQILDR